MARYIDADDLRCRVKTATNPYGKPSLEYESGVKVLKMIDKQPTEDVVPKSEVEQLIYKLECLLCHATGNKLSKHTYDLKTMESVVTDYVNDAYWDGHAEAKQEVASEIFAEIEKIRANEIHKCETLREKEVDSSERKYWEGGEHSLRQLSYWLAELKKKYTEEQK